MTTDMAQVAELLQRAAKLSERYPDHWSFAPTSGGGARIGCPDGRFVVVKATGSSRGNAAKRYASELDKHGFKEAVRDMIAAEKTASHGRATDARAEAERQVKKIAARAAAQTDSSKITRAAQRAAEAAEREAERERRRVEAAAAEEHRLAEKRIRVAAADAATRAAAGPFNNKLLDPDVALATHTSPVFLNGLLGPELANLMLERNTDNRPLRHRDVNDYADQMERGKWTLSNDALTIDRRGVIQNGQHRLHAIVKSGATIHVILALGMPEEAFATTDTGLKRTFGDAVAHRGLANGPLVGAACRLLYLYTSQELDKWRSWKGVRVHNDQVLAMVDAFPRITDVARHVSSHTGKDKGIGIVGSALITGRLLIEREWGHEAQPVLDFFDALDDQAAGLPKEDPRWVVAQYFLRARLASLRSGRSHAIMSNEEHLWLLLTGWNRYITHQELSLRGFTLRIDRPMPAPIAPVAAPQRQAAS